MDCEKVFKKIICTHRAPLLFWCPKVGWRGGGGTPKYDLDRYHRMYCLIAMVFEGLHS